MILTIHRDIEIRLIPLANSGMVQAIYSSRLTFWMRVIDLEDILKAVVYCKSEIDKQREGDDIINKCINNT